MPLAAGRASLAEEREANSSIRVNVHDGHKLGTKRACFGDFLGFLER